MRRLALGGSLVALVLGFAAQPAPAAPPPTLTGERFDSFAIVPPAVPSPMSVDCRDNPDGTVTVSWRSSARPMSAGPYDGSFTERGAMTTRRAPGDFEADVLSLTADYTIESSVGQVSGTKRLTAPVEDAAVELCDPDQFVLDTSPLNLAYAATITTPQGVFADRGQAVHDFNDQGPNPGASTDLREDFSSSLAATEQQGSILFGKRTPGGSRSQMSANAKRASPFTLYFPARASKIHAYIDGDGAASGSQVLRGVLYGRAADGGPGARLGQTFQFTVPAGMSGRWLELYLAPPVKLSPGVYWLGIHSGATGGVARFAWDPKDNSRRFNMNGYPDGPSDPFGPAPTDDQQLSIFASGSY